MTTTARFLLSVAACSLLLGTGVRADDPPKTLSYGVGLRVGPGLDSTTGGASSDTLGVKTLDVRPYISGQVHPLLKFEGNLDLNNGDQGRIHVLDAVATGGGGGCTGGGGGGSGAVGSGIGIGVGPGRADGSHPPPSHGRQ